MKGKVATHQVPGESRGGDDDTVVNAMLIGWVGGSCPAHAVSLHALTAKHNKTATMVTSQGKGSVLKLEVPALLLTYFNQRQECFCNMHTMPRKKYFIHVCLKQFESYEAPHINTC